MRPVWRGDADASLSSRRAWIEIDDADDAEDGRGRRSPHGERGLKFRQIQSDGVGGLVALLTESVD